MARLMSYGWPGNVRELENVIERGVVLARGDEITLDLLPKELVQERSGGSDSGNIPQNRPFNESVALFERRLIEGALRDSGGVQKKAAEALGLKPTTLNEKIKRLGI